MPRRTLDNLDDLAHQHCETTIPDEADDLAIGECNLRGDRVWHTTGHCGEVAGTRVHLAFLSFHITSPDSSVGAGIGDDDENEPHYVSFSYVRSGSKKCDESAREIEV